MKIQVFQDVMIGQRQEISCDIASFPRRLGFFSDTAVITSDLTLTKNAVRNAYYKLDSRNSNGMSVQKK